MSQVHPMEAIAENAPAKVQTTAPALRAPTDVHSVAVDLFSNFTDDKVEENKLAAVKRAVDKGLTFAEFEAACKAGLEQADTVDKAAGWTKPEGAKGQQAYGPKTRQLRVRLSEAKRVFYMLKVRPEDVREQGFYRATETARKYLDDNKLDWKGEPKPTDEQKAQEKQKAVADEARNQARDENPMQAGETLMAYEQRITALMPEFLEAAQATKNAERAKKIAHGLLKQFKNEHTALLGALTLIANGAFLDATDKLVIPEEKEEAPTQEDNQG